MLGAIIGDIVGSRFEFNNTDNYNFELFTEESTFTDDTICTIAIADAINNGEHYEDTRTSSYSCPLLSHSSGVKWQKGGR